MSWHLCFKFFIKNALFDSEEKSIKLLRHTLPRKEESLLSYIYMLARENHCTLDWLIEEFKLYYIGSWIGIDLLNDKEKIHHIAEIISNNEKTIFIMTLNKYSQNLSDSAGESLKTSDSRFKKYIRYNSTAFCPLCINKENYFKTYWHLSPIKVCLEHNAFLLEECSCCGNEITLPQIVYDKCNKCGAKLSLINPDLCTDILALECQNKVYQAFGIMLKEGTYKHDYFNKLSSTDYLDYVYYFMNFVFNNHIGFRFRREDSIKNRHSKDLYTLLSVEKIFVNWPQYFYLLIDDYNRNTNLSIEQVHSDNICNILNPINNITFPLIQNGTKSKKFRIIYSCLFSYFIERFNTAFFKEKLKLFLIEDCYIPTYIACKVFRAEPKDLCNKFKSSKVDGGYCVELNIIIELLLKLVKIGVAPWNKMERGSYKGLTEILQCWRKYDFTMYDIIKIAVKSKVSLIINPFEYSGFDIFRVHAKNIENEIIKEYLKIQ